MVNRATRIVSSSPSPSLQPKCRGEVRGWILTAPADQEVRERRRSVKGESTDVQGFTRLSFGEATRVQRSGKILQFAHPEL